MKHATRKSLIPLFMLVSWTSFAHESEPIPTRWRGPGERPLPPPSSALPYAVREEARYSPPFVPLYEPGKPAVGRIAIVVATNIYASLSNSVNQYAADLLSNGFSTVIVSFSGSAEELRTVLSNYYYSAQSLKGALLVGELPYAVWEMRKSFSGGTTNYEADLADIFFMDLNGSWHDTNSTPPFASGRYDGRSGDLKLEIWVSRLRGKAITAGPSSFTNEVTVLTNYFGRNHRYRIRNLSMSKRGLTYTDNDWKNYKTTDELEMMAAYPTAVVSRAVGVDSGASGIEFRDVYMTQSLEMIQIRCHGNATAQTFDDGTSISYSTWTNKDPKAVFYNIYGCAAGDFLTTNNLARIAIFNRDANGLVSWSHSGQGGMIGFWGYKTSVFFETLGEGETVGEAFRRWYNSCVDEDLHYYEEYWMTPKWWNGMILNGDGALTVRTPRYLYVATNGSHTAPFGSWAQAATNIHAAFDLASPGDVLLIGAGRFTLTNALVFTSSKGITLRGTAETNTATILQAKPGTNVVRVTTRVPMIIENCTLTGGSAPYGGGAYMNGGTLRNCLILQNTGTWAAGGVYLNDKSCRIENSQILSNTTPGTAGGALIMSDGATLMNCLIAHNTAETAGGVSLTYSGLLSRCTIINNRATGNIGGGGVYVVGNGAEIWNCIITGNVSYSRGGGLMMYRGRLHNSLVAFNMASNNGGGIFSQGFTNTAALGSFIQNCTIAANVSTGLGCGLYATQYTYIVNSILYTNGHDDWHYSGGPSVTAEYCCIGEPVAGIGNIHANPLFQSNNDFRLSAGSPCRNAGTSLPWHTSSTDLDGLPRVMGAAVDLGAYESQEEVGGDTDQDGMPDAWELFFGLNPANPADANEYLADTCPTNRFSVFYMRDIALSNQITLSFPCSTSRVYSLEFRSSLATGQWMGVAGQSNIPGHASGTLQLTDTNGVRRFFRVRAEFP